MIPKKYICGVVVLYYPDDNVVDNIKTYINQINYLFVVVNSKIVNQKIKRSLLKYDKVEYIENNENLGIAVALNIGASRGIKNNYKFILTMDQDSRAPENMIEEMFYYVNKHKYDLSKIGVISPLHYDNPWKKISEDEIEEPLYVMTSGNLLNLEIYKKNGIFMNELFIDRVDDEYCLRLLKNGYKVILVNKVRLEHNLGDISNGTIFGRFQTYTNHSPLRRYYITRNSLYVVRKYKKIFPKYKKIELKSFFYEFCKILLFEKDKFKKIYMIIKGYLDFKKGITGKLMQNKLSTY